MWSGRSGTTSASNWSNQCCSQTASTPASATGSCPARSRPARRAVRAAAERAARREPARGAGGAQAAPGGGADPHHPGRGDARPRLAPRRRPRPAARARRPGRHAAGAGAGARTLELRACIGADAARRCAERATPAQRAEIAARAEALAATADPEGRNAEYERLWAVIVDAAGNLAYRLALNTLDAGQHVLVLDAERVGRELDDGPRSARLAAAIAAGERRARPHARRRALGAQPMSEVLYYAIPFFVLLLVVEALDLPPPAERRPRRLRAPRHAHEPLHGPGQRGHQRRLEARRRRRLRRRSTSSRRCGSIPATGGSGCCSSSPTTSPTTGSTASPTRAACSGRATSSTTPPSTTTSRPRCARPGCR